MKLLVTGGAGFIGSAVVRLAVARGHEVINLDKLTYAACLTNVASVAGSDRYSFEQADICDRAAMDRILAQHRPDAILHLAAESHVDRSIDGPGTFIDTNITGTYTLLEAARAYWMREGRPEGFRFHHISTDEVYGTLGETGLFTEDTAYAPNSPYSASKAASDHLVRAWHETYGLPVVMTNCSNNYGPYHFPEKLIPVVILNALAGKPIPVYGRGQNVRDWLYVEDHADALLLVCQKGALGRSYNIGGNNERRNIDLVRTICALLDDRRPKGAPHDRLITFVEDRPGHDMRYAIDATRIREELGWEPSVTVEEGLARTVDWYLENQDWWRALLARDGVGARLGTLGADPAANPTPKETPTEITLAPPKERLVFDGERASPWVRAPLWAEHLHRYLSVLPLAPGKRILDIASGEGYGAAMLHRNAPGCSVIGADVAADIVTRANRIYGTDGLQFVTARLSERLPFDSAAFDLVTCFETIEHVLPQDVALSELRRVLAPGGVLAISTPDADHPAHRNSDNPFHLKELTLGEFHGLLSQVFAHVVMGYQRSVTGSVIEFEPASAQMGPIYWERDGWATYRSGSRLPNPSYFIALASDRPLVGAASGTLHDGVMAALINQVVRAEGVDFPEKKT